MSSFDRASRNHNADYWSEITGIVSIQLVVLFVLSVAVLVYLNWSSKAAVSEFMGSGKASVSEAVRLPQPSGPLQHVKIRAACPKRA